MQGRGFSQLGRESARGRGRALRKCDDQSEPNQTKIRKDDAVRSGSTAGLMRFARSPHRTAGVRSDNLSLHRKPALQQVEGFIAEARKVGFAFVGEPVAHGCADNADGGAGEDAGA